MEKFIYVFDKEDCEMLIQSGYKLLKSNPSAEMYVFANKADLDFDLYGITYVLSDSITF